MDINLIRNIAANRLFVPEFINVPVRNDSEIVKRMQDCLEVLEFYEAYLNVSGKGARDLTSRFKHIFIKDLAELQTLVSGNE